MNNDIRLLLIESAKANKPIYYSQVMEKLGLKAGKMEDHNELSAILADISRHEVSEGRPMLSAMAMYSPDYVRIKNLTDTHGNGFYELAVELTQQEKNKLKNTLYAFEQIKECHNYWSNPLHYNLATTGASHNHTLNFFTPAEVQFLGSWGGQVYDKQNAQHVAAKNYIIDSVGKKTVYWSREVVRRLPGYDVFNWRMWSQRGWVNTATGKIQVAKFKHYTWARIFKKGDDYKDIFFTVGVDGDTEELVFKLDYYFEANSELNHQQKEIVKKNLPSELRWRAISINDLHQYNWQSLIELTSQFIAENSHVYDKLIELAWGDKQPELIFTNTLRKQARPPDGLSELPAMNPSFTGTDKDFIQDAVEKKEIGDAGEELVIQYEKNFLASLGFHAFADKVCKQKDGKGYDVLSYNSKGEEKYIEVKTTRGNALTPFDYTINEYLFASKHEGNYFIYRLYNYDEESNTADFFIIEDPVNGLLFQPILFKSYYKQP